MSAAQIATIPDRGLTYCGQLRQIYELRPMAQVFPKKKARHHPMACFEIAGREKESN
jgi:hypothetical protein